MSTVVLSRHELRWVLEQCGADRWPYPLRAPAWDAETEVETERHRAQAETTLRERGLLHPEPARALLRVGELVGRWHTAVDLVRRDARAPCAAVVLTDGYAATVLASTEHADAPVRVAAAAPDRLPEALLALVPPAPAGVGGPWPVPAPAVATTDPAPATDRARHAAAVVADLVQQATGRTDVGVATRPNGPHDAPVRAPSIVSWLDGPRGRFAVRQPPPETTRSAVIEGVNDRQLLADIRTVLGAEATAAADPRSPGRSTA